MLIYGCVCLVVAAVVNASCSKVKIESDSYAVKRVAAFCSTVATMNVALAFLYWGEWEFFGALYPGEAIRGRVMFAIVATVVCGLGLIGLSKIKNVEKSAKIVSLAGLSLVCAWSWELCFDAAVEDMVEGEAHPVAWKVSATLVMFAIIIPVYAFNIKPIAGP